MNMSDEQYLVILNNRIKKIDSEKSNLDYKMKSGSLLQSAYEIKIRGLEQEKEEILKKIKGITDKSEIRSSLGVVEKAIGGLDSIADSKTEKIEKIEKEIKDLQAAKSKLSTKWGQIAVDTKIKNLEKKVTNLKNKKIFFGNVQRTIMYPKYFIELQHMAVESKAQKRVDFFDDKIKDNEELKKMLSGSGVDVLKERVLDLKGYIYERQKDRAQDILDEIKSSKMLVGKYGARVTSLKKKTVSKLSDKLKKSKPSAKTAAAVTI